MLLLYFNLWARPALPGPFLPFLRLCSSIVCPGITSQRKELPLIDSNPSSSFFWGREICWDSRHLTYSPHKSLQTHRLGTSDHPESVPLSHVSMRTGRCGECPQWGLQCTKGKGVVWYLSDGNLVAGKDLCRQVNLE